MAESLRITCEKNNVFVKKQCSAIEQSIPKRTQKTSTKGISAALVSLCN